MRIKSNVFILILLFFIFVNIFNVTTSMAALEKLPDVGVDINKKYGTTGTIDPDNYNPDDLTKGDSQLVLDKAGVILGAVRNISVVVAVITLMVIGTKYILGSVEEKANYKATLLPYVIGCVLAVAGTSIVNFIYNMVK